MSLVEHFGPHFVEHASACKEFLTAIRIACAGSLIKNLQFLKIRRTARANARRSSGAPSAAKARTVLRMCSFKDKSGASSCPPGPEVNKMS